jgi:flavin-dependent dehydrogenase
VGLRTALPATPALARDLDGVIELHLYDGGYAGLLLQEDGRVNLCLSAAQGRMSEGRDALLDALWRETPRLADRIGAPPGEWDAIAGVPYGWRARLTEPQVYRVGDQAAVIASLAGDGIAIALASGIAAAQACLRGDGKGARDYQQAFARRSLRPVKAAEALRHMAEHRRERPLMMALARVGGLAGLAARMTRIG